ncbi:MAG: branched-chain alpha-keto acid dehydrogenase subunit E2 [Candidatus Omnitrophica bacterium CG11_big_fil_rev_8_21_14_0_20_45_26]|uniref:Dihydrolipoamide acetyltransferase component of pyruvate dehydrogenase complex n=1 Tax=Candidatus Abzuiibacterium crystallinum TaxID=1974748 RepID=A0A2H0LMI2_9BACT|nr:MAG: branched-chain alpha-keto acid dehydrogenase subunit E2 [Candidatus Omnitrophica bacterium CG11_big_fil_rev_8_21_14_0_20_45_26]PIW65150.1 MAG: branched-chain alpha-keto acid dehydrogenase subunit E2 [Candidatus Omnitrophica bacterium CG12_big_fil_rev_8_21_14_0_65_45_16]
MDVRVPILAEGINAGTVIKVLVSEGDTVKKDQDLVEIETEKAAAPIPSPVAGKVNRIHVKEGDAVSVGQVIISISESGTKSAPAQTAPEVPQKSAQPAIPAPAQVMPPAPQAFQASASQFGPAASPTVRKLARELGIDLTRVRGSEHGGRIVVEDLRNYIQQLQAVALNQAGTSSAPASASPALPQVDFRKWGPVKREKLSSLRKKIGEKMVASWTHLPHVTQFDEADVSDMLDLRKKYVANFEKQGTRLTLTVLILKAVVDVLKRHPIFNASIDDRAGEIVFKQYYHFGIAVDTEQGLIVPVIRNVDQKNLVQLAKELQELAQKTRDRKVALDDLQGGTFTITNQGGIGGAHFTPIINAPEAAILGLGQGMRKPVDVKGEIKLRTMVPLCLSYDHRLIDGGKAAKFIRELRESIEAFSEQPLIDAMSAKKLPSGKDKLAGSKK